MVNVCAALVSAPPLAVPPSSLSEMVMVAEPLAFAAGVYVSVPLAATAGWAENSAVLSLLLNNTATCQIYSLAPDDRALAHPETACAPESSSAAWSAPLVKLGASLTA